MLMDRIAGHSAEFAAAATDCTGWDAELGTASEARHFHASIVSSVTIQNQSLPVFNFEVEDDHSYIANGFAVHNCPSCVSMHGTVFPLDAEGPLDHQSGRCTAAPITKTWRELGIDLDEPELTPIQPGADWFAQQPEATQRSILGASRFDAWKAGRYPPEQWAALTPNTGWRPSYKPTPAPSLAA